MVGPKPAVAAMHAAIAIGQARMDALTKMIEAMQELGTDDQTWCIDSLSAMISASKEAHMRPLLDRPGIESMKDIT